MNASDYVWLLMGMGLVTYGPRWLPLVALTRWRLPAGAEEWLDLVAPAILAALLLPSLMVDPATRDLDLWRSELWVAVPTVAVAWRARSLGGSVVVGMFLYWLVGKLGGAG